MNGWILVWWNVGGKRWTVEIPAGYKVKGNEQQMRKRKGLSQRPELLISSLAYDWCNAENRKTANVLLRYRLSVDCKIVTVGKKSNKINKLTFFFFFNLKIRKPAKMFIMCLSGTISAFKPHLRVLNIKTLP